MGSHDDGGRDIYYRRARVGAALVLFGLVLTLGLIDAITVGYAVDPIIFGLLLAAGLLLLGIDPGHLR